MRKISAICAYCGDSLSVSRWDFGLNSSPVDIYCPACGGRNNVSNACILLSIGSFLLYVFCALIISKEVLGFGKNESFLAALLFSPIGLVLSAYMGGLVTKLVKFRRWWIRNN